MNDIQDARNTAADRTPETRRAYQKPELVKFGKVVACTLGSFAGGGESGSGGNVYCYQEGACDGFDF